MGSDGQVGWKQITVVFCVLLVILFVGAGIFKALEENFYDTEAPPERVHNVEDIVAEFVKNYSYATNHEVHELLRRVDIARHGYSLNDNELSENTSHTYHLDYMESWYFCMTIVTTIGYGHMGPLTDAGKVGRETCAGAPVGFGDFVPALPTEDMNTAANIVYKISVFLWITVGLAFLAGSLERIGTALKILGEKMTDMDLDPAEITDRPEGQFITETDEKDLSEGDHLNGTKNKNGSDNIMIGREPNTEKEIIKKHYDLLKETML
uniref:Potassium channel domain-containing protein n=1 Tax=Branchiostoma floridae TaxID=7739 RepID=C3YB21_BRAFL|eukprot:XP_002606473.1 hypothetical protein BRAFLDRAFT_93264 [Branchiostoma floridae]